MDLFYLPFIDTTASTIIFPKEESRHIAKVLRKQAGDQLQLTDGKGLEVIVEIEQIGLNQLSAKLLNKNRHLPSRVHLHLGIAPTKNISRMEWFLEKATEIGIQEITPWYVITLNAKLLNPSDWRKLSSPL